MFSCKQKFVLEAYKVLMMYNRRFDTSYMSGLRYIGGVHQGINVYGRILI